MRGCTYTNSFAHHQPFRRVLIDSFLLFPPSNSQLGRKGLATKDNRQWPHAIPQDGRPKVQEWFPHWHSQGRPWTCCTPVNISFLLPLASHRINVPNFSHLIAFHFFLSWPFAVQRRHQSLLSTRWSLIEFAIETTRNHIVGRLCWKKEGLNAMRWSVVRYEEKGQRQEVASVGGFPSLESVRRPQ